MPLDPEYPRDRLSYMQEDSGIGLLLTQASVAPTLPLHHGLTAVQIDTLDVSGESTHDPQVALHAQHLAYVIYTSGSTGRPKGAANRHGSLYNRLAWMQEAYELSPADAVLQKTSFSSMCPCGSSSGRSCRERGWYLRSPAHSAIRRGWWS